MDTSMMLARVIGISLLVASLGMLFNKKLYHSFVTSMREHPVILFLSGFVALVLGLLIVQVHNIWEAEWPVVVTIFGWVLLLGGAYRILFPVSVLKVGKMIYSKPQMFTLTYIGLGLLGLYLTSMGFCMGFCG